jgi:hypothetical protein
MTTLDIADGLRISFDPDNTLGWDIFDADSGSKIGCIQADSEDMITLAQVTEGYRRRGIATAVIKHLVHEYGYEFSFWPPDGNTYEDGRHLSEEGACLANSLVEKGLARWVRVGPCEEDEDF